MNFRAFCHLNQAFNQHRGSYHDWLRRHAYICRLAATFGPRGIAEVTPHLFMRIRDGANLFLAARHVVAHSGSTAGLDGETVAGPDYFDPQGRLTAEGQSYLWGYAHYLRRQIDAGTYDHGLSTVCDIPKASGHGTRPIHLLNLADRIVHRAVVQIVSPLLEAIFTPTSFGGRPGLCRLDALATAERHYLTGCQVLVVADLKDAFERVPQQRLLDLIRHYLPIKNRHDISPYRVHETLDGLLEKLIIQKRIRGLRQGAATSSLWLNLYCHHLLDQPWAQSDHPPLLRYVDDLLILNTTTEEALAAQATLENLLRPTGMRLKAPPTGQTRIRNLAAGADAEWLGYRLLKQADTLQIALPASTWYKTYARLMQLAQHPQSPLQMRRWLQSWIRQRGPAYPSWGADLYRWFQKTFRTLDLGKLPNAAWFDMQWDAALTQWQVHRTAVNCQTENTVVDSPIPFAGDLYDDGQN